MTDKKVYAHMLIDIFNKDYYGPNSKLLIYMPRFFNLLQKIYLLPDLDWKTKFKINCCFSYFVTPGDIINDNDLRKGYIDDLYICVYVLNDILDENPNSIKNTWEETEDIDLLIKEILSKTSDILEDKTKEILDMVGLLKFNEMCQIGNFICESVDINTKVERINHDIQELISLIKTVFIGQGERVLVRKLSDLKSMLTEKQWGGVVHILQEIEIHESKYDNRHELKLEEIKRKVLLDIDESLMADSK